MKNAEKTQINAMNGIICIDKPSGFTSFDVVAKMRGILKTRKIGHGGTLDPMATGVLPLFLGRATKACDMFPDQSKRYTATFRLGITTDTQDITGEVVARREVRAKEADVESALTGFIGEGKQLPPMFSAVWVDGKRLYDLARQGIEVEREHREICVKDIKLIGTDVENGVYSIDVECSKGTYIRTLCHDIGEALGCGAVLISLRRTKACGYNIASCITLDEAREYMSGGTICDHIMPVDTIFSDYPKLCLDEKQAGMFFSGVRLSLDRLNLSGLPENPPDFAIYGPGGEFIAIAGADPASDELISKKWFGPVPY